MRITRAVSFSLIVCLAGGILASIPDARADDCSATTDAAIAQAKVPHADTHVMTAPGKPAARAEMIFTADKAYTQMNGAWSSIAFSAQQQIDTINAAKKRGEQEKRTCQKSDGGAINGEATSLFTMNNQGNGGVSEARLWISDKTGLPLKSEVHLKNGTVVTDDFRYGDIKAPPDVN
jgi:hypothetical protein